MKMKLTSVNTQRKSDDPSGALNAQLLFVQQIEKGDEGKALYGIGSLTIVTTAEEAAKYLLGSNYVVSCVLDSEPDANDDGEG